MNKKVKCEASETCILNYKEDIHGSPFLATIGSLFFFLSDARKREVVFLRSLAVSFYKFLGKSSL